MPQYKVIFALEAKQDLIDIQNYIYEDSQSLAIADNFVLDLFQTLTGHCPTSLSNTLFTKEISENLFFQNIHTIARILKLMKYKVRLLCFQSLTLANTHAIVIYS